MVLLQYHVSGGRGLVDILPCVLEDVMLETRRADWIMAGCKLALPPRTLNVVPLTESSQTELRNRTDVGHSSPFAVVIAFEGMCASESLFV